MTNTDPRDTIYVGDMIFDQQCVREQGYILNMQVGDLEI